MISHPSKGARTPFTNSHFRLCLLAVLVLWVN